MVAQNAPMLSVLLRLINCETEGCHVSLILVMQPVKQHL